MLRPVSFLLLLASACSSSPSDGGGGNDGARPPDGACYENPLGCDEDETCGFDDADGEEMSCQAAGTKGEGDACTNVAGNPECGPDLTCLQLSGSSGGTCAQFCDGDAPCDGGQTCGKVTTAAGHSFYACVDA